MSAEPPLSVENCPTCGAEIDVTGFEPLTPLTCPQCGAGLLSGRFVGDYELLDLMGRGGMGVVYRAVDRRLERPVALKLLHREEAQEGFISKLEAEAAVTASINHPNVVKVFTTGFHFGRFFIAMELVDKGTLDELIELQGRVAETQALEVAVQMAQGLRAAHQHGLIHRDIKPGNILFSDSHTAKIVDFGLAIMEEAASGSDEIWGTPYYVSPERLEQKPEDFRSDMYSMGATVFHAIAGRPPFEAEDATRVALKHLKSQAVSLQAFAPWVSGSTAYVINKTLSKDPQNRYGSYDELIEHLEYARNELATGHIKSPSKSRVVLETEEDRRRSGYIVGAMIGLILLLGVGLGSWFYFSRDREIKGPPETASVGAEGKRAEQYEAARQLLLQNQPAEAARGFHDLAAQKSTPEPLLQWAWLQAGLAWLVAGEPVSAQGEFRQLAGKPYVSRKAPAFEAFFRRASQLGQAPEKIDPDTLREVSPQSHEALMLLLAALRNWDLGQFEAADSLFEDFTQANVEGAFGWINQYRPLATAYREDFAAAKAALATARKARSGSQKQEAAKALRAARQALHRPGRLDEKLEEQAVKLTGRKAASTATPAPKAP